MKPTIPFPLKDVQIEIHAREVMLLFPNRPTVNFSLDIPDLRCAAYSPTYTYKAWIWCAYINALHATKIQLGYESNHRLFQRVWRRIENSLKL